MLDSPAHNQATPGTVSLPLIDSVMTLMSHTFSSLANIMRLVLKFIAFVQENYAKPNHLQISLKKGALLLCYSEILNVGHFRDGFKSEPSNKILLCSNNLIEFRINKEILNEGENNHQ